MVWSSPIIANSERDNGEILAILELSEILSERRASSNAASIQESVQTDSQDPASASTSAVAGSQPEPESLNCREDIAQAARLSSNQVVMIEKIQKLAAPELVAATR